MTERSKQNKHFFCDEDDDVDNGVDNGDDDSVDNDDDDDSVADGDDDGDDDGAEGADKHLTHLSQSADCCLMERSKQKKHLVCNQDDDVDNGVDNSDNN
eukprot:13264759-Ditylum_brightwellii.AAC.1